MPTGAARRSGQFGASPRLRAPRPLPLTLGPMNRPQCTLATISFAVAALSWAGLSTFLGEPNKVAAVLAVPGGGTAVRTPFYLWSGGTFRLTLSIPMSGGEEGASSVLWGSRPCFIAAVSADGSASAELLVDSFRSDGTYVFGNQAYFASARTFPLSRGEGVLSLRHCDGHPNESTLVQLVRAGDPTSSVVLGSITRVVASVSLMLGFILSLVCHFSARTRGNVA